MPTPNRVISVKGDEARAEVSPGTDSEPQTIKVAEPAALDPRKPNRLRRRIFMGGALVAVMIGIGAVYIYGGRTVSTDNAYIQAGMLVVTPAVEGIVSRIAVNEGQEVKPGDLLFSLDPEPFRIAVDAAQAQVDTSRLNIRQLQASYRKAQFDIQAAEAQFVLTRQNYDRVSTLVNTGAVSRADFDTKKTAFEKAESELAALQETAATILASLGGKADGPVDEHPSVAEARAQLDKVVRDQRLSEVRATIGGRVAKVDALQRGTRLSAGQAAFYLVGGRDIWIDASLKETDLTYLRAGVPAKITVDAYPGHIWRGYVAVISPASALSYSVLPAQNASGNWVKVVQRVGIRVAVDQDAGQPVLRPGMSTEVEIDLGRSRSLSDLWGGWFTVEHQP